jgi:hypothetical protein
MKIPRPAACALGVIGAAFAVTGCGGGAVAPNAGSMPITTALVRPPFVHPDRRRSWVSSDVKQIVRLLFVSDDATDDVYIFTTPSLKLKGTLTGFDQPGGLCSDPSGNVWVANTPTSQMLQYSRAGTLLKTLPVSGEYPVGCAFDKTGDLAVANLMDTTGGPGNIEIFANGSGTGTAYTNPYQWEYFFPVYDPKGNLYVDGLGASFTYMLSELPVGTSTMQTIAISGGTIDYPGGLNWYTLGNYLIAGDQECGGTISSCEYWVKVSAGAGTITGSTPLTGSAGEACDVDQSVIAPADKYVAGGCISQASDPNVVGQWPYSAGGQPSRYTTDITYPAGAAISSK